MIDTQNIYDDQQLTKALELSLDIDESEKGILVGVGSGKILGVIPYIEIQFGDIICPINLYVVDVGNDSFTFILGLSFIMFYKINLNFEKKSNI